MRWSGSAYDALGGLLELLGQELAALGHRVLLFGADGQDWPRRLLEVLQQGDIAFAVTMSGIGMEFALDGKQSLWEAVKVPMFNWSCDHPCHYPSRHGLRSRFLLHGYVFPDHAHYNRRYLNPNGMAFGVHIGMPRRSLFPSAPLPIAARNGRIIFSKSGQDTNQIEANWRARAPIVRQILFDAAEELFHRNTADFMPVLQGVGEQQGLLLDGNNDLALVLLRELEFYIRGRRGNLVVQTLLDYPVDVFGSGWDHIPWAGARATFQGVVPWRVAAVERLPQYLGCLSINPLVDKSVHDRVFFALAAGVVPVSDGNEFSRARMPGLQRYCFDFTRENIAAAADALLAEPDEALARTEIAFQELMPDFTIQRAAQQIMQFAALHEANARCAA